MASHPNHHEQAMYPSTITTSHGAMEEEPRTCMGCKVLRRDQRRLWQALEELRATVGYQTETTRELVAHIASLEARLETVPQPQWTQEAPQAEEGLPLPVHINESTLDSCIDQALRHLFSIFRVRCAVNTQYTALHTAPELHGQLTLPPASDPLFYVVFLTSDRFEEQLNQAKFEQLRQAHPRAVILAMRKGNNPQCFKHAKTTLFSAEDTQLLTFYFGLDNRIGDHEFNRRSAEALRAMLPAWALPPPPKKRNWLHLPRWL